jgi:hypothetical protein
MFVMIGHPVAPLPQPSGSHFRRIAKASIRAGI